MQRIHLLKLVNSIKQDIPDDVAPSALVFIQDVEEVMIYLYGHVNKMYDRDAFDDLQVDFQIFLYLFQRLLHEGGPGTLIQDVATTISSAPNQISEGYAMQLCAYSFHKTNYIKYGKLVLRNEMPTSGRGIKRALGINDFFHIPPMISKIHERTPPSITRDHKDIIRVCGESERQRHPEVQPFQFLFDLYRMCEMQTTVTRLLTEQQS